MNLATIFDQSAARLAGEIAPLIAAAARVLGVSVEGLQRAVIAALTETAPDGRAIEWRARLMLFSEMDDYAAPIADSDLGLPPGAPGALVFTGLPSVLHWISELAATHHGQACAGLDNATLQRKLRSLRVQMTHRGNGTGRLLADYSVWELNRELHMRAVCEVERVTASDEAPRRLPGQTAK